MICFSDLLCFRMFHVIIFLTDLVALQLILGCLSWSQGFYLHTKAQTKKWKLKYLIRYLCINTLHTMKGKHCGRKICSICNKHGNNILGIHLAFLGFPGSSAGKESACNAGYSRSVPGLGRSPGERDRLPTPVFLGFIGGSDDKEYTCSAEELGLTPGLGWSPGEGNGYQLQYSGLEKSMSRGAWQATVHGVS